MRAARVGFVAAVVLAVGIVSRPVATAPALGPGYQQFLSAPSPLEIAAAKKGDRIAWIA